MAHELDMSNNRANMAYVGQLPWHGLGQALEPNADLETWAQAAGLSHTLKLTPCYYLNDEGSIEPYPRRRIVLRTDTQAALACVSDRYKLVQPREVLEFYRDLINDAGFVMQTAGCLFGGRQYWALAKTGQTDSVIDPKDKLAAYVLLATSCDGTLATTARFTSVRVVCNNTLSMAYRESNSGSVASQRHSSEFNADALKRQLGLATNTWSAFMQRVRKLASTKIEPSQATDLLVKTLGNNELSDDKPQPRQAAFDRIMALFQGQGRGADLEGARGTAWGLLNAVTDYVDHEAKPRAHAESRFMNATFGEGNAWKLKMQHALLETTV